MNRAFSIFKTALMLFGALCVIIVLLLGGLVGYQLYFGNRPSKAKINANDVRFVLNWCNLGQDRTKEVIYSYRSSRSFTGDYLDAYAIKISHVDPSELTPAKGWFRGDQLPPLAAAAVDYASGYLGSQEIPWFPKASELRSDQFYVYPWSVYFHGTRATAAELIFVRPSDKTIFYMGSKT